MSGPERLIPRLTPAFRVGITGPRELAPDALPAVQRQLDEIFQFIKSNIAVLLQDEAAKPVYSAGDARLTLISPLAEGADRLAAHAALAHGFCLHAPLPFAQADYESDFPGTVRDFRSLLHTASSDILVFDGKRGPEETRSYEAAGRFVVRNCDLLVAVWDGGHGRGRGGTAEIVRYAVRQGRLIWWIRANGGDPPAWLDGPHALASHPMIEGPAAWQHLTAALRAAVLPPASGTPIDPVLDLMKETNPPRRFIWSLYSQFMAIIAYPAKALASSSNAAMPQSDVWSFWQRIYEPVDSLAVAYGSRYRSSYILVFTLAAFALGFAALSEGGKKLALFGAATEFMLLAGIFVIVKVNVSRRWHQRLIAYRLLAELCRKQQALALFGWRLQISNSADDGREAWVGWMFQAASRAAPLQKGELGGANLASFVSIVEASLVAGQAAYHAQRREACERAAERLSWLGRMFFAATFVMVIFKCCLALQQVLEKNTIYDHMALTAGASLRLALGLLPGLSAAFVGIRGYAELELLADQSKRMLRVMKEAEISLRTVDPERPLASEDIGAMLLNLTEVMMVDIKGWTQLFRIKAVEPG